MALTRHTSSKSHEKRLTRCYCGGKARPILLKEYSFLAGKQRISFLSVPADKCARCKEIFFTPNTVRLLEILSCLPIHAQPLPFPSTEPLNATDVKRIRKHFHATHASFANLLGAMPTTVALWEQGRQPSSTACMLMRLLETLKVATTP